MSADSENALTEWVPKELFLEGHGNPWRFTEGQIRGKIQREVWTKGVEYGVFDGNVYLNPREIEAWFGQQAADQRGTASSRSVGVPLRTGNQRISDFHTPKLASARRLE